MPSSNSELIAELNADHRMPPRPKGASPTPRARDPATSLGCDSVEGKTEAVGVYGRFRPAAKGMPEGPIEMLSAHKVQVREYEFTLDGVFEQITTQQQVARLPILTSQPCPQPSYPQQFDNTAVAGL